MQCKFITTHKSPWHWFSERSGLVLPQWNAPILGIMVFDDTRSVFLTSSLLHDFVLVPVSTVVHGLGRKFLTVR